MAWIEVHQALITHRKLRALARASHTQRSHLVGHLVCLWSWCVDNAPDGDLTDIDERDLKDALGWTGKIGPFLEALTATGWLDDSGERLTIHDWDDYAGRLISKRAANVRRMRHARATERATHVQGLPTVPNQQNSTVPPPPPDHVDAVAAVVSPDTLTRCIRAYDSMMGTMATTPTISRKIADWLEGNEGSAYELGEWFESACDKAALQDKRSLAYVLAILKREKDEGRDDRRAGRNGDTRLPGGGRIPNEPGFNAPFVSGLEIERLAGDTERPVGRFRPAADSPFSEDHPGGEAAE